MATSYCTRCGTLIPDSENSCPSCGAARQGVARSPGDGADEDTSFFQALFDLSFSTFITLKFIKTIYIIGLILGALVQLGFAFSGASNGGQLGLRLFGAVIGWFIWTVIFRVWLEIIAAVFRIAENTSLMVRHNRS